MPTDIEKRRVLPVTLLFLILFIASSAAAVFGQEEAKLPASTEDTSAKKFTVGIDLPDERAENNKDTATLFISSNDTAIVRFTILQFDKNDLTARSVTPKGSVSAQVSLNNGVGASVHIAALDDKDVVLEQRRILVPGYGPAGQQVPLQIETSSSNTPVKNLFVKAPSGPVSDSLYVVDVRPRFRKANNDQDNPIKYVVELYQGDHRIDGWEEKVEWDKDDKTRPKDPVNIPITLRPGRNIVRVRLEYNSNASKSLVVENTFEVACTSPCNSVGRNINTRAIVGFEQAGASSATGIVKPFLNFFISAPLGKSSDPLKLPRLSIWTDFRLTSTAAQRFVDVTKISTAFSSTSPAANEVVQSFRVNAGLDYRIAGGDSLVPFFLPGKSSLSLIGGVGITSPLTYQKEAAAEIFKIPTVKIDGKPTPTEEFQTFYADLRKELRGSVNLPELPDGSLNIAFMQPERIRFYRRMFVGGRLKVDFWENYFRRMDLSPAVFDITLGFDESVRDGRAFGKVLSYEGFIPFPITSKNFIFLYGGGSLALTRQTDATIAPIHMARGSIDDLGAATTIVVPGVRNPFTRSYRDTYFFGVGIDFLKLFGSQATETKP